MSEPVDTDKVREWGICDCENLCDEVDDLRARLAEVEAERDIGIAEVEAQRDKALADLTEMTAGYTTQMETISGLLPRLREIEARLAEVEALCMRSEWAEWPFAKKALAAARGEGDRG